MSSMKMKSIPILRSQRTERHFNCFPPCNLASSMSLVSKLNHLSHLSAKKNTLYLLYLSSKIDKQRIYIDCLYVCLPVCFCLFLCLNTRLVQLCSMQIWCMVSLDNFMRKRTAYKTNGDNR